jgi:hypothetical protein
MRVWLLLAAGAAAVIAAGGCSSPAKKADDKVVEMSAKASAEDAVHADSERVRTIKNGSLKISKGMSAKDVRIILGEPDEILNRFDSFDDITSGKKGGFTFVYIIRRDKKFGSMVQRNEILLKVLFDNDNKVAGTEKVGFK